MGEVRNLNSDEAWAIASAAKKHLARMGKKANVCVVNREGAILLWLGMEETKPMTAHAAKLKAQQAAHTGRRTRFIVDMVSSGDWGLGMMGIEKDLYCPAAGGVPIYSKDKVLLGGCGIANLPPDDDEAASITSVEACGYLSDFPT